MNINRHSAKHVAQAMINDTKPSVIVFSTAYNIFIYLISFLVLRLSGMYDYVMDFAADYKATGEIFFGPWPEVKPTAILLCVLLTAMQLILEAGFANYALCVSRRKETSFFSLFSGFEYPFKAIAIILIRVIAVEIGYSLFVIPGLILNYWYCMSLFVLAEHPEYSIFECLSKSRKMVNGYKLQLFYLDISFMGWVFLSRMVSAYTFPLVEILLKPYISITFALYYNLISSSEYILHTYINNGNGDTGSKFFNDAEIEPKDSSNESDDNN